MFIGSGGLTHTKIDETYDNAFLKALSANDADYMSKMTDSDLTTGTSEIRNWIIAAMATNAAATHVDYVPCYRSANGVGCAMGFAYWDLNAA
jgi:hypothetical protein